MNTQGAIERFILDADTTGKRRTKIDPDESLIGNGILDSMALLQLVVFLEERFGITVEDGELIRTILRRSIAYRPSWKGNGKVTRDLPVPSR